jgi:hypothetical protein
MLNKFEFNKKYIAKFDYLEKVPYLPADEIKKGEYVIFMGKNLGFAKFRKDDGSLLIVDAILAFKLFDLST